MIELLRIIQEGAAADEPLEKYIQRKIGTIDRFLPRRDRENIRVEIKLKDAGGNGGDRAVCEVTLRLPKEVVFVTERTINMYAAVDIVEMKLRQRINRYKHVHGGTFRRRLARRLLRRRETIGA